MADLTPRQQRFVEEYLKDLNAAQASIRAGYAPKDANVQGSRLLATVGIAEAISEAKARRSERTEITADMVLQELRALGFAKITDYVTWGEKESVLKPSAAIDGRAVLEFREKPTEYGPVRSIKLHDKLGALAKIGQHLGMFEERVALANANNKPFQVEDASLSDEERAARLAALLDRARARGAGPAADPEEGGGSP